MAGSAHITTLKNASGKRYIVRYRRGGRGYPLEHGGSFRRLEHAKERERLIGGWLALGLNPRDELARLTAETEPRLLSMVAREWLASRIDLDGGSRRVYSSYISALVASSLGDVDVAQATPADVREQIEDWVEDAYAPKTIHERVSVIRQVFDFAEVSRIPLATEA